MAYQEKDSVRVIPGVGEVVQAGLERLGITTISDLLRWYPRTYLDASNPLPIRRLRNGELTAIEATIQSVNKRRTKGRGLAMLEAEAADTSGEITLRWFNQAFLAQKLVPGSRWVFIGMPGFFQRKLTMLSPLIEMVPKVLSVYGQTRGITSKMLRGYLDWVLKRVELNEDPLPLPIISEEGLLNRKETLASIHQPGSLAEVKQAQKRLAFEEVFWFFARVALSSEQLKDTKGVKIDYDLEYLQKLVSGLPFTLTDGQKRAVWEIVQEMATGKPMTRLLNGDVGSGKTVVAGLAAAVVAKAGFRSIIMVPTEILAKQHLSNLQSLLKDSGLEIALWTAAQKDNIKNAQIIIGTQAVLQESFALSDLGLLIVDEQHRFGVRQRQLLRDRQDSKAVLPHLLSMTATPIPRTLALVLYGNLSVSFLKDKPKDRLPVKTEMVLDRDRAGMHQRILAEIKAGRQVFVVCPLIEEKKEADGVGEGETVPSLFDVEELGKQEKKAVTVEAEKLRQEHPEYGVIEVVHGKMKAEEKREVMRRMSEGGIQVLVATSVIEVGVDMPRATVMVIEGAERFGLAQLHQFRGRVGRGKDQAYCFLCPSVRGEAAARRLRVLVEHESGFAVAEQDLALRGPGELVGQIQSGLPDFRMASLTDLEFLQHVKGVFEGYRRNNPDFLADISVDAYSNQTAVLE